MPNEDCTFQIEIELGCFALWQSLSYSTCVLNLELHHLTLEFMCLAVIKTYRFNGILYVKLCLRRYSLKLVPYLQNRREEQRGSLVR